MISCRLLRSRRASVLLRKMNEEAKYFLRAAYLNEVDEDMEMTSPTRELIPILA